MPKPRPLEERFWEKVRKTDSCWEWIGAISRSGYGTFWVSRKRGWVSAHRFSWSIHHGPLAKGACHPMSPIVMHSCDNKICVRPDHILLGSFLENTLDMLAKGRAAGAPRKTTADQARAIRSRYKGGEKQAALGAAFGISVRSIRRIVRGARREAAA